MVLSLIPSKTASNKIAPVKSVPSQFEFDILQVLKSAPLRLASKRCSSTTSACRCDRARVLAITNLDGSGHYTEAVSFVDADFVYRLGEVVVADSYNEDRWLDSSHGIHFWMTKEEALGYM